MQKSICITIFILLFSLRVFAQDTIHSVNLDSVQVRASKTDNSLKSYSSDNLSQKHLQTISVQTIGDAGKYLSGALVKDYGGLGGVKTICIRGLSSNHTAVLYDGIGIFDNQSGQIDLSKYSVSNASNITLSNANFLSLLPTASSLASANVVNIESKKPDLEDKKIKADLSLLYGSYNLANISAFTAFKLGKKDVFSLFNDILNTDGKYHYKLYYGNNQSLSTNKELRKNNDLFCYHNELNWYHSFNAKNDFKLKAYHYYSNRGLPSSVSLYYNQSKQRLWNENAFVQSAFTSSFSGYWTYKNNLKFDWNNTHYKDPLYLGYEGGEDDKYDQYLYYMNNALAYKKDNLSLTLTNDITFSELNSSIIDNKPKRTNVLSAIVAQYKWKKTIINANLLHSLYFDKYNKTKTSQYLSPYVAFNYDLGIYSFSFFYKNIFRMPTFNELYYRQMGNKNLNPEKTAQFSTVNKIFIQKNKYSLLFEADIYYNNIKDKIVAIPKNVFLWSMLNYGKVSMFGTDIKLGADILINKFNVDMKINYSFCNTKDKDKDSYTYNQTLPYMPKHVFTTVLSIDYKAFNIGYTCQYVSKRYSLQENISQNLLKSYFDNNANIGYAFKISKTKLNVQFSLNNISNKQYEVIRSYPMMGRNYNFKITINI